MEDTENLRRRFLATEEVTYCYKLSILGSFVMIGYCWDTYLHGVRIKVILQPLGKKKNSVK